MLFSLRVAAQFTLRVRCVLEVLHIFCLSPERKLGSSVFATLKPLDPSLRWDDGQAVVVITPALIAC
jgi:hypothetical protein